MPSSEKRWELFINEVCASGIVWTIEKNGEYATHTNRYGKKCFPWWSSRERVIKQLKVVPEYSGYKQIGFEWPVFVKEWVPSLQSAKCLLGVNYATEGNVGLDLPISEVVNAIEQSCI